MIATLEAGQTYPVEVDVRTDGTEFSEWVNLWLDMNQDGAINATTELLYQENQSFATFRTFVGSITVPTTAFDGQIYGRIIMQFDEAPALCGNYTYGTTVDFLVGVTGGAVNPAAPLAPTNVTAVAGNGEATVSFTPAATGPAATEYTIVSEPGGISVTTTSTSVVIPGLTNGQAYTFTVYAKGTPPSVISSGPSDPSNTVTPFSGPSAGSSTAAVADVVAGETSTITAQLFDTGGNPVTGAAALLATNVSGANTAGPLVFTETTPGVYTATYVPTVAGTDSIAVTVDGAALSNSPLTSQIDAGDADAASSTAAVSDVVAGDTSTVTVELFDDNGNPVTGAAALLAANVTGANTAGPLVFTETSAGVYTASYVPTVAGTDSIAVSVDGAALSNSPLTSQIDAGDADAASSTAAVSDVAAGDTSTVTVELFDANGNPVTGAAALLAASVTGANSAGPLVFTETSPGVYTASYVPTVTGTDSIAVTVDGAALSNSPLTSQIGVGDPNAAFSTAAVSDVVAGETSTVTAELFDESGNPVTGAAAMLAANVTGANTAGPLVFTETSPGVYTASYVPTVAGTDTIAVTLSGSALSNSPLTSQIGVGEADAGSSTATVSDVVAGETSTITVELFDENGNPVTGAAALLAGDVTGANPGSLTFTEISPGVYTASYVPAVAGTDSIVVTVDGVALAGSPLTSQIGGGTADPASSTAAVSDVVAGETSTITVELFDENGNPVTGAAALLAGQVTGANPGSLVFTEISPGIYTASYVPTVAGTDTIVITVGGVALANSPLTSEIVVDGAVSGQITLSRSNLPADGRSTSVVTVVLFDQNGNRVTTGGAMVALFASLGQIGAVRDNGDGSYTAVFTASNAAGASEITLSIDGIQTTNSATIALIVNDGAVADAFSEVTSAFIERRMDRILATEPLSYRLDRRREVVGRSFSVELLQIGGGSQGQLFLSGADGAKLAGSADMGMSEGAPTTMLNFMAQDMLVDGKVRFWAEGMYSVYTDSTGELAERDGQFGVLHLGGDVLVNQTLSFGMMVSIDHAQEKIDDYSKVSGTGWMVGPYVAGELMPDVFFTGRLAYGRSNNSATINVYGNDVDWSGDFDTDRLLARVSVYGETTIGNLKVTPALDIAALRERQDDYLVSNGIDTVAVDGDTKTLGRVELSSELVLPTNFWPGAAEFYATPSLAWDFRRDFIAIGDNDVHGSLEIGLRSDSPDGWKGDVALRYDGLGESGFDGVSLRAGFSITH